MTTKPEILKKLPKAMQKRVAEYKKTAPKIHFSPAQLVIPKDVMPPDFPRDCTIDTTPINGVWVDILQDRTKEVYKHFKMPFPLYDYQQAWVDAFGNIDCAGLYAEVGAGKTATATVAALWNQLENNCRTVVLMPPILIRQWYTWLNSIGGIGSVLMYKGTPKERERLSLDHDFVLMSMDIFKRDFERIYEFYKNKPCTLIVDEAVCIKNPSTQNHKCVWAFHNLDTSGLKKSKPKPKVKADSAESDEAGTQALMQLQQKIKEKYNL